MTERAPQCRDEERKRRASEPSRCCLVVEKFSRVALKTRAVCEVELEATDVSGLSTARESQSRAGEKPISIFAVLILDGHSVISMSSDELRVLATLVPVRVTVGGSRENGCFSRLYGICEWGSQWRPNILDDFFICIERYSR